MSMAFYRRNEVNTTTQFAYTEAPSESTQNLFDRDENTKWEFIVTTGITSPSLTISLGTSTVLSHIFIQNHNLQQYLFNYRNTTTAGWSSFSPSVGHSPGTTTVIADEFWSFSTVTARQILITLNPLGATTGSWYIGELYIGSKIFDLERNPPSNNYKPVIDRQQVVHRMPNGGVTQFIVANKFKTQLKWDFLTESFTSQLLNLYETATSFYFIPFGTTTSWDGKAYEVAWTNDFDFRHTDNNKDAGYSGSMTLEEIA